MITSVHPKSSNSPGFNTILEKFYEMICEIIVSKVVCRNFLIFCRLSFINNFMIKNNFSEPKNHRKLNISRSIYFKKISAHCFLGLICTKKLEEFFFFFFHKVFSRTFFHNCKTINLGVTFFHKKLILYFFQGWLFNFNIILKACFNNLLRKTAKKWLFYSFK